MNGYSDPQRASMDVLDARKWQAFVAMTNWQGSAAEAAQKFNDMTAQLAQNEHARRSDLWARNDDAQSLTPDVPSVWDGCDYFGSTGADQLVMHLERNA